VLLCHGSGGDPISDSRDTSEGLLTDLAQLLLTILFLSPDAPTIPVPRRWIAAWYRDVTTVLEQLRRMP
jgi:hypothetical protein